MMNRYLFAALGLLTLFGIHQQVVAQLRTTLSVAGFYDDNLFRNSFPNNAYSTNSSLLFDYAPPETDFSFFAQGAVGLFQQYSDRRYFSSTLGGAYNKPFGEEGRNALAIGMSYFMRFNADALRTYDVSQLVGYANLKYYLDVDNGFFGRAGYRVRYRSYKNLDEFSYVENYGFLQLSKFFQTKTTLIAEFDVGNKNYVAAPTSASTTSSGGSSGGMHGSGEGGMTGEMHQGTHGSQNVVYVSYSTPNTTQLVGILRVAQSLSPNTGASIQYLKRWNLTDRNRFLSNGGTDFQGDAELWDDPYSFESNEYNISLTQIMLWNVTVRLSVDYLLKDYTRRVFIPSDSLLPSGPLRNDTRRMAGIEVRKTFEDGTLFIPEFTLSVSYLYQRNMSNDSYYDYSNNIISIGATIQL